MTNLKLFAAKYVNPSSVRLVYLLLAIAALALAGGAPDALGGSGCNGC